MPVILFTSHLASTKPEINFHFHDYENILDDAIACLCAQIKRKIGKKFYFLWARNSRLAYIAQHWNRDHWKNMIHLYENLSGVSSYQRKRDEPPHKIQYAINISNALKIHHKREISLDRSVTNNLTYQSLYTAMFQCARSIRLWYSCGSPRTKTHI